MNNLLLMICFCLLTVQQAGAQNKEQKLNLDFKDAPLKEILKAIEQQTEYSFVYNETIDLSAKKTVSIQDKSIAEILPLVFQGTGIEWTFQGRHVLLRKSPRKVTVSGYVTDRQSGETLIGASISSPDSNEGTITNNYGYFTFRLPEGSNELKVSYVGYRPETSVLRISKDTLIHVSLHQSAWLKEVVITEHNKPFSPSAGAIEFTMDDIKRTPAPFGETDVMRTLQLLPGVSAGVEGTSGIYVRGGGPDQNLTLLDGVNVYNTGHFMGLFSIFNGDAVKKVTLYKGSFPARFGGRLSSVVDVRMKDGDMQAYHGNLSIGLLSSHANLEGPIIRDRTSFNISARRSYVDAFLRGARLVTEETVPVVYFYDVNAKVNHKFSDKSRLYLSFYEGRDVMGSKSANKYNSSYSSYGGSSDYSNEVDYRWGNTIGSLRWNYIFNNKLFVNTTLAYNNYKFDFKASDATSSWDGQSSSALTLYTTYQYSGIEDLSANVDFEYSPNNRHYIRFGGGYIYHTFKPEVHGSREYEEENKKETINRHFQFLNEQILANETSLYAEDEISLTNRWKANAGLHFSTFSVGSKTYTSLQPRFSLGYELNKNLSFKTSYTEMSQYIHLLTSSAYIQPTDLWVPVTPELDPLYSRQATLGVFYDTRKGYNFSAEGYYKYMSNLLEYKDGASWGTSSTPWYRQVEKGDGRTYGVELFAQKTTGKFTGWIGYTLAWNDRKFPTINEGRRFPAKYDRRHDVKVNMTYKLNEKIDFSAAWMYASGNRLSIPFEEYPALEKYNMEYHDYYNQSDWINRYEDRNNYRMPPMHHLDLSMNYYRKKNAKGRQGIWNFTLYNVYNQSCPYIVHPSFDYERGFNVLTQITLLPILPSVSYTYTF